MKRIMPLLITLFFVAISPMLSYGAEKQESATSATSENRERYQNSMEERLKRIGKQLDELQVEAGQVAEKANKEINHQLKEANKKGEAASHELEEMRKKSNEEWKKFVDGMNKAADDFEKAYENAKSRFKE